MLVVYKILTFFRLKYFIALKTIVFGVLICWSSFGVCLHGQESVGFRIMFYNTENLFDAWDDSLSVGDDEYLPKSTRHWNYTRYKLKLNNIAKTILAAGEWQPPVLVGLCEVENASVLKHLIYWTGLSELGYKYVHYESPDQRGIDVALLYRAGSFEPIESRPVKVELPDGKPTRDILLVKGFATGFDTMYVLVNHWPSRFGGVKSSECKRIAAADVVLSVCDSIRRNDREASIVIMGDFNDSPSDSSINKIRQSGFVNLNDMREDKTQGTNKYRYEWETIDQIMISLELQRRMAVVDYKVVDLPFLLMDDDVYLGKKLFRTYVGPRYQGGFSDHLPVMGIFTP